MVSTDVCSVYSLIKGRRDWEIASQTPFSKQYPEMASELPWYWPNRLPRQWKWRGHGNFVKGRQLQITITQTSHTHSYIHLHTYIYIYRKMHIYIYISYIFICLCMYIIHIYTSNYCYENLAASSWGKSSQTKLLFHVCSFIYMIFITYFCFIAKIDFHLDFHVASWHVVVCHFGWGAKRTLLMNKIHAMKPQEKSQWKSAWKSMWQCKQMIMLWTNVNDNETHKTKIRPWFPV